MSETRPPMTAGPIDLAFRFLKKTSVSWEAPDAVVVGGITEEERAGVVAAGDAVALAPATGEPDGGDSSCAKTQTGVVSDTQVIRKRVLIRVKMESWRGVRWRASAPKKLCRGYLIVLAMIRAPVIRLSQTAGRPSRPRLQFQLLS